MKKILVSLGFGVLALSFALSASAQTFYPSMGMMGGYQAENQNQTGQSISDSNINAALQDIYTSQNVSSQSKVECSKVTDSQFEKLGDAYMGYGISDQQHTAMENMMGGEGSATLAQAHITMGRAYLGCWAGYNSGPVLMPMMGRYLNNSYATPYGSYGMMGTGWGFGSMMSGWGGAYSIFGWVTMLLVWVLLILGILTLLRFLRKVDKERK